MLRFTNAVTDKPEWQKKVRPVFTFHLSQMLTESLDR
jgi:hypothetical protein